MTLSNLSYRKLSKYNLFTTAADTIQIIKGILKVMHDLHDRGFNHGSLTTDNLRVLKTGSEGWLVQATGFDKLWCLKDMSMIKSRAQLEREHRVSVSPDEACGVADEHAFWIVVFELVTKTRIHPNSSYNGLLDALEEKHKEYCDTELSPVFWLVFAYFRDVKLEDKTPMVQLYEMLQ